MEDYTLIIIYVVVAGPLEKPQPVNETSLTATSATLAWDPPKDPNGVIVNYTIHLVEKQKETKQSTKSASLEGRLM